MNKTKTISLVVDDKGIKDKFEIELIKLELNPADVILIKINNSTSNVRNQIEKIGKYLADRLRELNLTNPVLIQIGDTVSIHTLCEEEMNKYGWYRKE